jgi:hypothetical protein
MCFPDFPLVCESLREIYEAARLKGNETSAQSRIRSTKSRVSTRNCTQCGVPMYRLAQKKFCSKSCSAISNNKLKDHSKQKSTITKRFRDLYDEKPSRCSRCTEPMPYEKRRNLLCEPCRIEKKLISQAQPVQRICKCGKNTKSQHSKFCDTCIGGVRHYRSLASFNFNVYDFPEEFDLSLIQLHGWYSPNGYGKRNKNPNLDGVSRDHMLSISDGFENGYDPKTLGHPANCRIMIHNGPGGNNSKSKSSITWNDLLSRIKIWDEKYGVNDGARTRD